jgi:hypothetical protein
VRDRRLARERFPWVCYGLSIATFVLGVALATRTLPEPFDWTHTVISALASRKHNPGGSFWFAGALVLAFALLWPVTDAVRTWRGGAHLARWSALLLRVGLGCGMLVGAERIVFFHFSDLVHKGHEYIALVAFLATYAGVLSFELDHARRRTTGWSVAALVLFPLVTIGVGLLVFYLGQRHLGWLDYDWSKSHRPFWEQFAFWQWLALAALWVGMGHVLSLARRSFAADRN